MEEQEERDTVSFHSSTGIYISTRQLGSRAGRGALHHLILIWTDNGDIAEVRTQMSRTSLESAWYGHINVDDVIRKCEVRTHRCC
jgi:hypothetical protein